MFSADGFQGGLPYSDSPLPHLLRLAGAILDDEELRHLIQGKGHLGIAWSKHALAYRQRPAVQRFGLGVPAEDKVPIAELAQGRRRGWVIGSNRLPLNRQRAPERGFGLRVSAHRSLYRGEDIKCLCNGRILLPERRLLNAQSLETETLRLRVLPFDAQQVRQIAQPNRQTEPALSRMLFPDSDRLAEQTLRLVVPASYLNDRRQRIQVPGRRM